MSIYVQNSSTPLTLNVQFQTNPNQLKENIIQGWLLYVIRSFLQVDFRFQYQLINLVWLSFDFFSFSWTSSHYLLFRGFTLLCVQLSNIIYNYSYFWYSFSNKSVFTCTTWKRKQTMEQQPHRACERTKSI